MTDTSAQVTAFLSQHPHATLADIAAATGIEAGALGTIVGKLMAAGMVRQGEKYDKGFRYEVVDICRQTTY